MLNLYKLEIFSVVVEAGSFSQAAERMFMTQSGISQHIQDLEASLGTELFIRSRRGVTLTASGKILYDYTRTILRLVAEAENAVTTVENLQDGHITIGSTPGISLYLMPQWLGDFRADFPNFTISMHSDITSHIVTEVVNHKLAVGFVEGELQEHSYAQVGVAELDDIALYVMIGRKHPWWDAPSVELHDLETQPFVTRQPNSQTRIWLDEIVKTHQIQLKIIAEFDNPESIKRAVCTNMGIAILPEYAVRNEVAEGRIQMLLLRDVSLMRRLKLIWAKDVLASPITRTFLGHLGRKFPAILDLDLFQPQD